MVVKSKQSQKCQTLPKTKSKCQKNRCQKLATKGKKFKTSRSLPRSLRRARSNKASHKTDNPLKRPATGIGHRSKLVPPKVIATKGKSVQRQVSENMKKRIFGRARPGSPYNDISPCRRSAAEIVKARNNVFGQVTAKPQAFGTVMDGWNRPSCINKILVVKGSPVLEILCQVGVGPNLYNMNILREPSVGNETFAQEAASPLLKTVTVTTMQETKDGRVKVVKSGMISDNSPSHVIGRKLGMQMLDFFVEHQMFSALQNFLTAIDGKMTLLEIKTSGNLLSKSTISHYAQSVRDLRGVKRSSRSILIYAALSPRLSHEASTPENTKDEKGPLWRYRDLAANDLPDHNFSEPSSSEVISDSD